jgi:hypothetical protein
MSRRPASLKSTTGKGYDFEDRIGAYYLACLLANEPPVTIDLGCIVRLDFQVRAMGWHLDDMLLTFDTNHRLALQEQIDPQ